MANKGVFLDRDHTLIEDPGYLTDRSAVKLLPGVETAVKSLSQAGYKVAVVTNQSGIARGLLTEEALENIHDEMRRQLAERGAHLDAIYYCPYHPEGTVERYARESDLRKPQPGMLIEAAKELDIDLKSSWMVGDSPRDIEAGQRAGCRTIRVRIRTHYPPGEEDEDVQADFTVRNLVDAARVIMREAAEAEPPSTPGMQPAGVVAAEAPSAGGIAPPVQAAAPKPGAPGGAEPMDDSQVRREILQHVRHLVHMEAHEEFNVTKLIAGIVQVLALLGLLIVFWKLLGGPERLAEATVWGLIAVTLQVMALTFFMMQRK